MSLLNILKRFSTAKPPSPLPAPAATPCTVTPEPIPSAGRATSLSAPPTPERTHAKPQSGQPCVIEGIDPATGERKFVFDSINAAGREGFCYQGVYNVLTGARKTHKGADLAKALDAAGRPAGEPTAGREARAGRPQEPAVLGGMP